MRGRILHRLRDIYDTYIREHTPRELGVYNGVVSRKYHLFDLTKSSYEPEYKAELVGAVKSAVEPDDSVVEIGSGFGVCTVWAARIVGDGGHVHAYEASRGQVAVIEEALELTGDVLEEHLRERVDLTQALVGPKNKVYGSDEGSRVIDPAALAPCDVLVMDCEGAEREIIGGLETWPETIVVESHPEFGAPSAHLKQVLGEQAYALSSTHLLELSEGSKDIITATKRDD